MSDGKRWHIDEANSVAARVQQQIEHYCERIEVVGSVRRGKREVGDVELLFIPKFDNRQIDMFVTRPIDTAHERIIALANTGFLAKRLNKEGHIAGWGTKNKLAVFVENGMPVDLFSTTADDWWVSLVIRTGGKYSNLRLTTGANILNRTLNAYGCGVTDRKTGIVTAATSERHVFELCGVPYQEPEDRG